MGGPQRMSMSGAPGGPIQGMFTRNLIGNCAGSAFRLHDTKERIAIWFVMQDLSVRTEGAFRCVAMLDFQRILSEHIINVERDVNADKMLVQTSIFFC